MQFQCSCGKTLMVADNLAGKKVRCPACKEVVVLPKAEEEEEVLEAVELPPGKGKARPQQVDEDTLPPRKKSRPPVEEDDDGAPPPRKKSRPVDEEDEEESPRPKKKARSNEDEDYEEDDRPRKKKPQPASFWSKYGLWVGIGGGGVAIAAAIAVALIMMSSGGDAKNGQAAANKDKGGGGSGGTAGKSKGSPGGMSAEEAKARLQSINNLKLFALAIQVHEDAKRTFPPAYDLSPKLAAVYQETGQLLNFSGISWRIWVLPYMEQSNLFTGIWNGQFQPMSKQASEFWNRPQLLKRMPPAFASPVPSKGKDGHTYYRVFLGGGAAFEKGKELSSKDFPDGLENTIMMAEAGDPVPWTKPEELEYDPAKPLPKLGGLWDDGFYVAFMDASISFIPRNYDELSLRALITRNGGEKVQRPQPVDTKALAKAAGYKDED